MRQNTGTLTKNNIILIAVNIILVIALVICLNRSDAIKKTLRSQQAAPEWAGQSGERFAQVSAFLPQGASFNENSIRSMRESIDRALLEASLEATANRSLYVDAWSALGTASVTGERGTAQAQVIGVGGDFFLFHPLFIRDGSYIYPNDLMKDRVVLDEELAWRLFGSVYLEGMQITINSVPYYIAGVVAREKDFASSKAYTAGAGMFMSYEALSELQGRPAEITCYEIVMPDPITGFALKAFTDNFPYKDAIVENSDRYAPSKIVDRIKNFGERSMRMDGMIYPYWENAARYTEDWLGLLLALTFLFAIFPAICSIKYGTKGLVFLLKLGFFAILKKIDKGHDRKAEEYRMEHLEEIVIPSVEEIIREVMEEREKT